MLLLSCRSVSDHTLGSNILIEEQYIKTTPDTHFLSFTILQFLAKSCTEYFISPIFIQANILAYFQDCNYRYLKRLYIIYFLFMDFQCITSVEISIPQIKSIIEFFFIKNIIKVIHFFTIKQGGFP